MTTLELILTIIQLISGLAVTVIVLMQSGKSAGLSGAIAGGAETFLSKGKAKTLDAKLAKATKWFGLVFVILTLVLTVLMHKDAKGKWYNDVVIVCDADTGAKVGDMMTAVVTVDGVYSEQSASGADVIVPRFKLLFVDKIE